MSEAFGDADLRSLTLDGARLDSNILEVVTDAEVGRTIDGADTLSVTLRDPHRKLLKSGIFSKRVTAAIETHAFEIVQLKKTGDDLGVEFEDLVAARLRSHTQPRKVEGGTMTRSGFVRSLVAEEPWIRYRTIPVPGEIAKSEMSRGDVVEPGDPPKAPTVEPQDPENTWDATGRLADEVGWRRFSRYPEFWYVSETFLFGGAPAYTIGERTPGVDSIDFDWDIGKPVAQMTITARAKRWTIPPGTVVEVVDIGPASGKWLVSEIRRSLFSTAATITLKQPRPTIPEPVPKDDAGTVPDDGEIDIGGVTDMGGGDHKKIQSSGPGVGWWWPVIGPITSGFGVTRPGHKHAGIDIGVPVGTPVKATREGVVTVAQGGLRGYGNAVYIRHLGGTFSRYGHVSEFRTTRGAFVRQGEVIALSGGARGAPGSGDSSGPHLHFEIRPNDIPANPLEYLSTASGRTGSTGRVGIV